MFFTCVCGKSTYSLFDECQYCGAEFGTDSSDEPVCSERVFDKKQMRLFDVEPEQE